MKNNIFRLTLNFFIILFVLLILLIIVNLIPNKYIENNVRKSVEVFMEEGNFPKVKYAYNYKLDNYTDALMINTAYSVDSEKPLESAILMRRGYRPNENLKLEDKGTNDKPILQLMENVNKTNETYSEYSRYWHGYMIFLRPLLIFFNYVQIRIIMIITIIFLSLVLIYLTYKKINIYISIAAFFALLISNFIFIGMSLHHFFTYVIMLISSIYIILKYKQKSDLKVCNVFFLIGMLTSFFDLLSYPLITFGVPAIYYILLKQKEDESLKYKTVFKIMIFWILGYTIMWFSKWIISDILYNTGTISDAFSKIFSYTASTQEVNVSILDAIKANINFVDKPLIFLFVTAIISLLLKCKFNLKKIKKENIIYLIIGILPFAVFAIMKNHSYIHARFTNINLLITNLVLLIITVKNIRVLRLLE